MTSTTVCQGQKAFKFGFKKLGIGPTFLLKCQVLLLKLLFSTFQTFILTLVELQYGTTSLKARRFFI